MAERIYLTKSRYVAGLQCLRRLWLNVHEPVEWEEPDSGSAEAVGLEIGRMARLLFPGGILVEEPPWEHAQAVVRTMALMADRSVPAIFEAAFVHSGVRIRVDVLERRSRRYWGICEVKSSGEVKIHHYDDVAVQVHVLRGAGVRVSSVDILHVNKAYVRGHNGMSWPKFFSRVSVKAKLKRRLDSIGTRLKKQRACLARGQPPNIDPESHCHSPVLCEHWKRCTESKPSDWVFHMPNFNSARRDELRELGIEAISAIPDDFHLSPRQRIIRDVTRSGKPYVATELGERLRGFGPPAFYLDFEAFLATIPLYPGTRPYQAIPFQWSLHHLDSDGAIEHKEFLAEPDTDPRRPFAETLIKALERTKTPIVVYSSYERTRLIELAVMFPGIAKHLGPIVRRLRDLLPVVRSSVYHPHFDFSSSIKTAAPAICPDVRYDDLEVIADGDTASRAFWLMASGQADADALTCLIDSLRAYCKRDTWTLLRLHQGLAELARQMQ